eukprot:229589-Pyramimonas_sp.AAC.1
MRATVTCFKRTIVMAMSRSWAPKTLLPLAVERCGKVLNCLARAQSAPLELPFPAVGVAGVAECSARQSIPREVALLVLHLLAMQ